MRVPGERKQNHQDKENQAGGKERLQAQLHLQPPGEIYHAKIRHQAIGFTHNNVVHQDPADDYLHHHRTATGHQDQEGTDNQATPVRMQPTHDATKQLQVQHGAGQFCVEQGVIAF